MLWEVYRYFTYGWIARYYVEPVVNFTYYGFSWVKPWPGQRDVHSLFCARFGRCLRDGWASFTALPRQSFFLLSHTLFCWTKRVI